MRKNRRISGFTLMELLAVVAILGILAGVAFIAVQRYQRSTEQLEVDTVAKEIFIAAQNHLTMSRNEGYLGLKSEAWGAHINAEEDKGIYYICCSEGSITDKAQDMLGSVILPFGSIDETVRAGNYIIRYQPQFGLVLDVFYSKAENTRFGYNLTNEYNTLISGYLGDDKKSGRRNYEGTGKVIGYYGGQDARDILEVEGFSATGNAGMGEFVLKKPVVTVNNGDTLFVEVKDTNVTTVAGYQLKLLITGETSGTQRVIQLCGGTPDATGRVSSVAGTGIYKVILDDITDPKKHFAVFNNPGDTVEDFINGENITIQAVAFNNTVLSNIGYSDVEKTNSLFEKLEWDTDVDVSAKKLNKVSINNIRHLENLDTKVSSFGYISTDGKEATSTEPPTAFAVTHAVQTSDMKWDDTDASAKDSFVENIGRPCAVCYKEGTEEKTTEVNCFKPVELDAVDNLTFTYDGNMKNIFNLKVAPKTGDGAVDTWDAGMFGNVSRVTTVKNLALIDSDITAKGTGNAGALAGTITSASTIKNVVAYNSTSAQTATVKDTSASADIGDKGGLIGSATGCTISKCAAALVVNSTGGNAGGLIGTIDDGTVTACYSGGHTILGKYYNEEDRDDGSGTNTTVKVTVPLYNVVSQATDKAAGGLIGNAGSTTISQSYSTCSANGATAGGFIGTGTGTVSNCYATGLVGGTTAGAFAGQEGATWTNCLYYEIINEYVDATTQEIKYLGPVPGKEPVTTNENTGVESESVEGISRLDKNATIYEGIVGGPIDKWTTAYVYDSELRSYYHVVGDKTEKDENGQDKKDENGNPITTHINEDRYTLQTVQELGASVNTAPVAATDTTPAEPRDFVCDHYGDWPAPEIFVFNTKS